MLLVSLCAVLIMVGCATSGKVLTSSAIAVDAAMKGWAYYVVTQHPSPAVEQKVRDAHTRYLVALNAAEAAWYAAGTTGDKTAVSRANTALTAAQADLIVLIATFQNGGAK